MLKSDGWCLNRKYCIKNEGFRAKLFCFWRVVFFADIKNMKADKPIYSEMTEEQQ